MPDLSSVGTAALTVLGIGFLILAHEFGHFIIAKLCKVRVEVFSVGFGRPLLSKKVGDTEYRLAMVFIGGYVKMAGDPMSERFTGADYELQSKSATQRVMIYAGGPAASALTGLLLFWMALQMGILSIAPRIGYVEPGYPAAEGGLLPGDELVELDGTPIHRWEQFEIDIAIGGEGPRKLKVRRDGAVVDLNLFPKVDENNRMITRIHAAPVSTVVMGELKNAPIAISLKGGDKILNVGGTPVYHSDGMRDAVTAYAAAHPGAKTVPVGYERNGAVATAEVPILFNRKIGVMFGQGENLITEVVKDMPAATDLGIVVGDRITAVDTQPVREFNDLFFYLHLQDKDDFEFTWEHEGESITKRVSLRAEERTLPIAFGPEQWVFRQGPVAAITTAGYESFNVWKQIRLFFTKLFSADAREASKSIGGPIGIFTITYRIAQEGYGDLLFILAMISVNLAIVNILPIPLLDGGQVLFIVMEKLKGSPLHPRSQDLALYVGLFIILSLFIFATLNDLKMLSF